MCRHHIDALSFSLHVPAMSSSCPQPPVCPFPPHLRIFALSQPRVCPIPALSASPIPTPAPPRPHALVTLSSPCPASSLPCPHLMLASKPATSGHHPPSCHTNAMSVPHPCPCPNHIRDASEPRPSRFRAVSEPRPSRVRAASEPPEPRRVRAASEPRPSSRVPAAASQPCPSCVQAASTQSTTSQLHSCCVLDIVSWPRPRPVPHSHLIPTQYHHRALQLKPRSEASHTICHQPTIGTSIVATLWAFVVGPTAASCLCRRCPPCPQFVTQRPEQCRQAAAAQSGSASPVHLLKCDRLQGLS